VRAASDRHIRDDQVGPGRRKPTPLVWPNVTNRVVRGEINGVNAAANDQMEHKSCWDRSWWRYDDLVLQ